MLKKNQIKKVESKLVAPTTNEVYAMRIDLVLIFLNIFMEL